MAALAGPEATDAEEDDEAGAAAFPSSFLPWLFSFLFSVVSVLDDVVGSGSIGTGAGRVEVVVAGISVVVVVSSGCVVVVVLPAGPVVVVVVSGGDGPVPSDRGGATGFISSLASTGRSTNEALSIGRGTSSTHVRPGRRRA